MNLILDLGNTKAKIALFHQNEILFTDSVEQLDEVYLDQLLSNYPDISHSIISSVINNDEHLQDYLAQRTSFTYFTHETPIPIRNIYRTPHTLGKDRLAAAIGAFTQYPGRDVLSVDAGTALKFDFVNAQGEYEGGAISPGMWLRFKALYNETDKLPLVGYKEIEYLIGRSTEESILSGVIQGIAAEVDGIIDRYKEQFPEINVIITGGESVFFEKKLKNNIFADSNLVLRGLNIILEYVKQQNA